MGFYGSLVTNTAIAKEGTSTNWERGWAYFRDFADPYWLWVPGVLLVAGGYVPLALVLRRAGERRALFVVASFFLVGLLTALYVVAVGGDYVHGRLFLPALFAACTPVAVVAADRRHAAALFLAPWVVAAVLTLRPPRAGQLVLGSGTFVPSVGTAGQVTVDGLGLGTGGPHRHWYTGPAFYFQVPGLPPDYRRSHVPLNEDVHIPAVAMLAIGGGSYALGPDFDVVDVYGLADPLASHLISTPTLTLIPRLPGHEKPMPSVWFAARITPEGTESDADQFPNVTSPLIPDTSGTEFLEQVAWARAALRCPEIRDVMAAAERPLNTRRFLDNFLSSFHNTRVRIPADPKHAYHRFCGSGTPREVREVTSTR
jgi:arabinofuranosyltransferase